MESSAAGNNITIHFISGLPRSGSTLLAALLCQNPRFRANMTSPVGSLFYANLHAMSAREPFAVFFDDDQRKEILRSVFLSYYKKDLGHAVVFDTNRLWCSKLPALVRLFPNARFICCVRDIAMIADSFERVVRQEPFKLGALSEFKATGTVYSRVEGWMQGPMSAIGIPLDALKEAFFGEYADRVIILDYDAFVASPIEALKFIYDFLDEPWFSHDPNNISFSAGERFDSFIGEKDLHTVKPIVAKCERRTILPPDLVARLQQSNFWYNYVDNAFPRMWIQNERPRNAT